MEESVIEIDGKKIGGDSKPYIIAEAGTNVQSDLHLAKAFIEEAAASGADAIKFQTHLPDDEMVKSEMERLNRGDLFERLGRYVPTSAEEHYELLDHCRTNNISFLSTPFCVEAIELLEKIDIAAYKIGSGELTNFHMLKTAAETGKPLIVSTGMSDIAMVAKSAQFLSNHTEEYSLLHCVSLYPAEKSRFNLGIIQRMKSIFGVPVGFSDHSTGVEASAIALAKGADIIEKHFTIDRRLPGNDQVASIEPEELEQIVTYAELCHATAGESKEFFEDERPVHHWARHSVVTTEEIKSGTLFSEQNLTTKRPNTGISATRFYDILGRRSSRRIEPNTPLRENDVQQ